MKKNFFEILTFLPARILVEIYLSNEKIFKYQLRNSNFSESCIYNELKILNEFGLIEYEKQGRKHLIVITEEGKEIAKNLAKIKEICDGLK